MMNNRYDIKIPNFSELGEKDVVIVACDEADQPSFKVYVYPHKSGGAEEYVGVSIRRCTHYPHRVQGLVESSLSFTVSIVDAEDRERFLKSFANENFFNLNWVVSLKPSDEATDERLLGRKFLFDQGDELLRDDALTIRVDVSYQVSGPSGPDPCNTIGFKIPKVVNEREVQRLEFIELIEESLSELREFVFLYQDLQLLHESLGSVPYIEDTEVSEYIGDTERFRGIFKNLNDCFRLHGILQKGKKGVLPYTDYLDEEEVKTFRSELWLSLSYIQRSNINVLTDLMDSYKELIESRRIVLDGEKKWETRMELVETRMQMIVRLFDLNDKLKECFHNREWLDRDAEEVLLNEEMISGKKKPRNSLKENFQKMFEQCKSLKIESNEIACFLEERIRFFIPFLSTIEILTNLVFGISDSFLDWTQLLIERYLPKDTRQLKLTEKEENIADQKKDNKFHQKDSCDSISEITIETETEEIFVPFVSKLLDSSPVFKQMLSHPFKEAIEGKLNLKHFDSVTVRDMLSFVDSGGSLREDMDRDECLSLYFMAHMYQVESLEERLADHLYTTLCIKSEKYVRKYSKRLGREHPLGKVLDKFYEDMTLLDKSGEGTLLDNEPEFRNELKDWARKQRMMYEAENDFNFYQ